MYRVIVADDETFTLKRLCNMLDWNKYGFELVGMFSDGKKAYDFIKDNHVDLVITDIEMPLTNGLELAKECYANHPNTYFIFVSAYRNFEYAREATKYNTIDYITKPFSISSFEEALYQAYKELSESVNNFFENNNTLAMQQYFFSSILTSSPAFSGHYAHELKKLGVDERILKNRCAVLDITFKNFQDYLESFWKYGSDRLYNAILFVLPKEKDIFSSLMNHNFDNIQIICISKTDEGSFEESINAYSRAFCENLLNLLNIECESVDITHYPSIFSVKPRDIYSNKDSSNKSLIEKAKNYIRQHSGENISLKSVADHVSLSPVYFGAFFKQQTGENFSNYLRDIRLEQALNYLINTEMSVVAICEAVGYKNTTYFYDLIKFRTGMTPNEYRSHHRQKEESHE